MFFYLQILPYVLVTSRPVRSEESHHAKPETNFSNVRQQLLNAQNIPKSDDTPIQDEQIISVRITSSVAVGRTKPKTIYKTSDKNKNHEPSTQTTTPPVDVLQTFSSTIVTDIITSTIQTTILEDVDNITELPPSLIGANIEFLKQLQAKKETRGLNNYERVRPFHLDDDLFDSNQTNDSIAESSVHSVLENDELINDVPLARSVPLSYSSKSYIQDLPEGSRGSSRLTTVNFNIVHDSPKVQNYDNDPVSSTYINSNQNIGELQKFYNHRPHSNIQFSQPSQIYSQPAKYYSEPAKIYSEPAKIYSEPAKIYSEPAKIYSEPAKFYSPPASLHLSQDSSSDDHERWQKPPATSTYSSTALNTTPKSIIGPPNQNINAQRVPHEPEKNYEVDEKVSVMTDGRAHGEQPSGPENCKQENCKVGYVVEGRQFRKYRVEERTSDGFIVGEYGVVRNEDGALRGVRYTADSDASPRLIHDALMKFLQLK
ncbi:unnamed protein product [Euphydryas editha]|uniref:Uncharacterized protein n=1 Tax=Euphydryas editha TaxID=104508 RepID=A0AAU9VAJ7_EUPED|nr:unnamed protein product [Euphydryas editha]